MAAGSRLPRGQWSRAAHPERLQGHTHRHAEKIQVHRGRQQQGLLEFEQGRLRATPALHTRSPTLLHPQGTIREHLIAAKAGAPERLTRLVPTQVPPSSHPAWRHRSPLLKGQVLGDGGCWSTRGTPVAGQLLSTRVPSSHTHDSALRI